MTRVLKYVEPDPSPIALAADVLRSGGLVAFPTETVYGLGANALDAAAVARIFAAKGRPATNPVIVHVASVDEAQTLARGWPAAAQMLAEAFWPGPLSLVVPKAEIVPDIVTAGGPTVALRVPAHPVALALLRSARLPVAAPSANRSACLSPTRAEHVLRGLDGRVDLVLDAGPTSGGLESTVIDVTTTPATLLRPGLIAPLQIEQVIGPITRSPVDREHSRAPGQMKKHYAPATPLLFTFDDGLSLVLDLFDSGMRVAWLPLDIGVPPAPYEVHTIPMPVEPAAYARCLFDVLHELDQEQNDRIVVALPPEDDSWLAIHDRLRRAASQGS